MATNAISVSPMPVQSPEMSPSQNEGHVLCGSNGGIMLLAMTETLDVRLWLGSDRCWLVGPTRIRYADLYKPAIGNSSILW